MLATIRAAAPRSGSAPSSAAVAGGDAGAGVGAGSRAGAGSGVTSVFSSAKNSRHRSLTAIGSARYRSCISSTNHAFGPNVCGGGSLTSGEPTETRRLRSRDRAVHLHHVQGRPVLPAGPPSAGGHLAVLLSRRQDRRARRERRRQVLAAADHGR